jgi:hypothetical protein
MMDPCRGLQISQIHLYNHENNFSGDFQINLTNWRCWIDSLVQISVLANIVSPSNKPVTTSVIVINWREKLSKEAKFELSLACISLRGCLARIYLGYLHFLILRFWNWIETNVYPPTTLSLLLYNGENLSLRSILLFAHGDICIGRFELYRQITRVRGKWIKKGYLIYWLCHRYLCECRLDQTCLVARLSATEIWATAIFFFNNWFLTAFY